VRIFLIRKSPLFLKEQKMQFQTFYFLQFKFTFFIYKIAMRNNPLVYGNCSAFTLGEGARGSLETIAIQHDNTIHTDTEEKVIH
jgi:hypothetical protein